jgi:hypothetical protein
MAEQNAAHKSAKKWLRPKYNEKQLQAAFRRAAAAVKLAATSQDKGKSR